MFKRIATSWFDQPAKASFDPGPLLFAAVIILLSAVSALYVVQHPRPVPSYAEIVPAGL